MTATTAAAALDPATAALHRAMPYTRLVDCGMNPADGRTLLTTTAAGQDWAEAATGLADARSGAAESALAAGHRLTAVQSARWAAAAALFAQMAENAGCVAQAGAVPALCAAGRPERGAQHPGH